MSKPFLDPPLYQYNLELNKIMYEDEEDSAFSLEEFYYLAPKYKCKFCKEELKAIEYRGKHGTDHDDKWWDVDQSVWACMQCGWWRYSLESGTDLIRSEDVAIGCILRAEDAKYWAPVPVLREFLAQHPSKLADHVDPIALEQVLRDVFSDYFDCEVRWTGRSADGGYDLYHVIDDTATIYQIKRRGLNVDREGVVPIRELLGTMIVEGVTSGVFVTTAQRFSAPAKAAARAAEFRGYVLKLIDYSTLLDVLRATLPKNKTPWRPLWEAGSKVYDNFSRTIVHTY